MPLQKRNEVAPLEDQQVAVGQGHGVGSAIGAVEERDLADHLAEVFGKPGPGGVRIDIPLSQQQLGSMVGMSRESMNKQLKQWRQDGLIRVEEGLYILADLDVLRDM